MWVGDLGLQWLGFGVQGYIVSVFRFRVTVFLGLGLGFGVQGSIVLGFRVTLVLSLVFKVITFLCLDLGLRCLRFGV